MLARVRDRAQPGITERRARKAEDMLDVLRAVVRKKLTRREAAYRRWEREVERHFNMDGWAAFNSDVDIDRLIEWYCAARYRLDDDEACSRQHVLQHAGRVTFHAALNLGGWRAAFDMLWVWDDRDKVAEREATEAEEARVAAMTNEEWHAEAEASRARMMEAMPALFRGKDK